MTGHPAPPPPLLRPAIAAIAALRTGSRLALVVVLLLVPGLISTISYERALSGQMAFSEAERDGVAVLVPALLVMADAVDEAGNGADLTALEAAAARHPDVAPEDAVAAVRAALSAPGAATPEGRVATAEALTSLVTAIANNSNLILDPDLDSFYVMESLTVQVPKALSAAASLSAPVPDGEDATAVRAVQVGALAAAAAAITADVDTARENTAADLDAPLQDLDGAAAALTVIAEEGDGAGAARVAPTLRTAVEPAAAALDDLLRARIAATAQARAMTLLVVGVGFAAAVYLAAAVWWRTRRDVNALKRAVQQVAAGGEALNDDANFIDVPQGGDDLGDIGQALMRARELIQQATTALEQRNVERGAQARLAMMKQKEAEQLRKRAQSIITETSESVVVELKQVVDQVSEMRAAADAIETHVAEADRVTDAVVSQAHDTDQVVDALGDSLRRVAEMAQLIAGVAGQSKLLALNATIEAVRAGDAGQGFGVVAGEVKELATTTARSTDQITRTVEDLERDTKAVSGAITRMTDGIRGVDEAASALRRVADQQRVVVEALDQVVAATIDRIQGMNAQNERVDRRDHERIAVRYTASMLVGKSLFSIEVIDLSEGGVRLRSEFGTPVMIGSSVIIDLELDGVVVSATATAVFVEEEFDSVLIGLRFDDLPGPSLDRVRSHLQRILTEEQEIEKRTKASLDVPAA